MNFTESTDQETSVEKCSKCGTFLQNEDIFCGNCGFPERGTAQDKGRFELKAKRKQELLADMKKKVYNGQVVLFVIAALTFLLGLAQGFLFEEGDMLSFIIASVIALVYVGLGIWSRTQPFPALVTGLIIYGSFWLLDIILDPTMLFRGILIRVLIIGAFISGIRSAKDLEAMKKELE